MIGSSIIDLVKEEAEKVCDKSGCLNLWMLARRVGFSTEIIKQHLTELGYVQISKGSFILKKNRGKAAAKESERLAEPDLSVIVSNDIGLPARDFIQQDWEGMDYTAYNIHELRSIASNKGIKVALSNTKGELIKKIKSKLSG